MDFDFESLFKAYPNKEGKSKGMKKLKSTIKTQSQYDDFKHAMENYLLLCQNKGRIAGGFVKMWSTFVNNWTDYLQDDLIQKTGNIALMERIAKGEL